MLNTIVVLTIVVLVVLMLLGQHVAFAMTTIGAISLYVMLGPNSLFAMENVLWNAPRSSALVAVPLFIFMGEILVHTGITGDLYRGMSNWLGRLPGGLLHSNIGACAVFAAISGSSPATAATIGTVAIPELEKRGYDKDLMLGSICAGGTLGILIPPSLTMIVYGAMVGESVGKLFIAGIIPGIILALMFMVYIFVRAVRNPELAPPIAQVSWKEKFVSLGMMWPILLLMFAVLGVIYVGIATPTEAAALGVTMSIILGLTSRSLTWSVFKEAAMAAVAITCSIMIIYVGASFISMIIGYAGLPQKVSNIVTAGYVNRYVVLAMVYLLYLILGCFFDPTSMLVLTLPVVHPPLMALGFDSIWFGIALVVLVEAGMITPPVGMNLYVMQAIAPKYGFGQVVRGVMPFFYVLCLFLIVITIFPAIVTILPSYMME